MLAYHRQNIVTLNVGQIPSSDFCTDIPTAKRSGRILHSTDLQQHPGNGRQGKPWRNSTRCIGRLHWQNLVVRDCRALRSAEEIFSALIEHVRLSTGTGKVVPMITIFAPEHSGQRPVRIWNRQLINYAGHRQSDGSIVGDPLNVPLTEVVRKLGWTRDPAGAFDLLPLLIETSEGLRCIDWPDKLILQVPILHPDHP